MTYSLRVVSQQAIVGRLTYEPHHGLAGRYSFAYDPTWLRRDDRFPLSPHLPLRGAPGDPDTVARFLANLLPEGRALEVAAAHHHIAKSNTFALIRLLGKEPVGALSCRRMGLPRTRQRSRPSSYRKNARYPVRC